MHAKRRSWHPKTVNLKTFCPNLTFKNRYATSKNGSIGRLFVTPPLSEIGKKIGKMSKYTLHFQSAFEIHPPLSKRFRNTPSTFKALSKYTLHFQSAFEIHPSLSKRFRNTPSTFKALSKYTLHFQSAFEIHPPLSKRFRNTPSTFKALSKYTLHFQSAFEIHPPLSAPLAPDT